MTRPEFFFSIPGKYFRCETDATQHIYLEKSHPICVGDFSSLKRRSTRSFFTVNISRPGAKSKE
jgi:hypothetical protein